MNKLSEQMRGLDRQDLENGVHIQIANKVALIEAVAEVLVEAVEYFEADFNQPDWFEKAKQALAKLENDK